VQHARSNLKILFLYEEISPKRKDFYTSYSRFLQILDFFRNNFIVSVNPFSVWCYSATKCNFIRDFRIPMFSEANSIYEENDVVKLSKNLVRYRSENNFVGPE